MKKQRTYYNMNPKKQYEPSEELEQITLFNWIKLNKHKCKELELLFHIPNGGKRAISEAKRFKAAGVKAGVPDLFLPVAANGYHGLFIEMKSLSGTTSKEQERWIVELNKEGYKAIVAHGWVAAVKAIAEYLKVDIMI